MTRGNCSCTVNAHPLGYRTPDDVCDGAMPTTTGRAARNSEGKVILYGDMITNSMKVTIDETTRRRTLQSDYNITNGITPETIKKRIFDLECQIAESDYLELSLVVEEEEIYVSESEIKKSIEKLEKEMKTAAKALEFERAAKLRDKIRALRQRELQVGGSLN